MRCLLKAKIHNATVTQADLNYVGSITIDQDLLDRTDLIEGEQVQVVNNTNGARLMTYIISGERGQGDICLNGAAARMAHPGDQVIIMAFTWSQEAVMPKTILVDEKNQFMRNLHEKANMKVARPLQIHS